ncbi:MAG TPA: alpha/beta hydrolase [Phycisphaerales bacterium]|nr:alpha/beta hydrolase [Phycisphaerales bacterium]HMP36371.1 alpha/beta hydrolase [Phycisphaerales bacterium]
MSGRTDQPRRSRTLRWVRRLVGQSLFAVAVVVGVLLIVELLRIRGLAPLEAWHLRTPAHEFRAAMAKPRGAPFTFADYLALEDRLFTELERYLVDAGELDGRSRYLRYVRGGSGDPATFDPNWNRTITLSPPAAADGVPPRRGALLLHGLTDAPYSMRSIAEQLSGAGALAVCLRLPGHGTVPAGLLDVTVEDWMAATAIAWEHLRSALGPDAPIDLVGYSNGGAVGTLFTLERIAAGEAPPERLILLSPAIGITGFARASNWHRAISWVPLYFKSRWLAVEPEFDPFKYNSFPKNAGAQSWALSQRIDRHLDAAVRSGAIERMPPVLTFQSVVDATVLVGALVTRLYDRLPMNGSELVLVDVNSSSRLDGFYREPQLPLEPLLASSELNYTVVVIGNAAPSSMQITARIHPARSSDVIEVPLAVAWPDDVFSLAHVSVPFPPDDPLYGSRPIADDRHRLGLGNLALRGERQVLTVSATEMLRLRHNPFHRFMLERMLAPAAARGGG